MNNLETIEKIILFVNSEKDRLILIDRYVNGLTYDQLAEKYDFSVSTIKRIIRKHRHKIVN